MKQVVIENPVLTPPFEVFRRHFRFDDEGINNEIVDGCRTSSYFGPFAKPEVERIPNQKIGNCLWRV